MAALPEGLLISAAKLSGTPYEWGGNGPGSFDCSGYVRHVAAERGVPLPDDVRTAEQIALYCPEVSWGEVQPGDLLFLNDPPDHVAFSLGEDSGRVWQATPPAVVETVIRNNDYWQRKLILNPRRLPGVPATPLVTVADTQFAQQQVMDVVTNYARLYGVDPRVVGAVCWQESGWKNHLRHADGTGVGLFGLDASGGLIEFERWSRSTFGRGDDTGSLPPVLQIEFVCDWFERKIAAYGLERAVRTWHRGPTLWNDARGASYWASVSALMDRL